MTTKSQKGIPTGFPLPSSSIKAKIFALFVVAATGTVGVFFLHLASLNNEKKNGFNRAIKQYVEVLHTLDVRHNEYYFAGLYNGKCYLANSKVPFCMLEIDDTVQHKILIKYSIQADVKVGKITTDSPYFYLADHASYRIYKGDLKTWTIRELVHDGKFFAEAMPISSSSIIFRSLFADKMEYLLSKENLNTSSHIESPYLLQKQIDGMFCTDGIIQFDKKENLIVYTYFYRNQFICTDTSLRLKYRGRTIDTTSRANIRVSKRTSKGEITLSSPPSIVNRRSYAGDGKIFINSNLIADNEDHQMYSSADVIDIYNSSFGKYEGSFYLPKINGARMNEFIVFDNFLYSLHDHFLTVHKFSDTR